MINNLLIKILKQSLSIKFETKGVQICEKIIKEGSKLRKEWLNFQVFPVNKCHES